MSTESATVFARRSYDVEDFPRRPASLYEARSTGSNCVVNIPGLQPEISSVASGRPKSDR